MYWNQCGSGKNKGSAREGELKGALHGKEKTGVFKNHLIIHRLTDIIRLDETNGEYLRNAESEKVNLQ